MSAANTSAKPLRAFIDGIGFWAPGLPDWPAAAAALRGGPYTAPTTPTRPAAARLPANERRRAPDAVLIALEVAQAAVDASGFEAAALASVFTSAHGDLAVVDALCATLASNPMLLSPTRFHHSVHNAASGYWAIASGSRCGSTALAGYTHSFGSGLLEALSLCAAENAPVLLVGADTEARGPMTSVNTSRGLLGVALVIAPAAGPRTGWALNATLAGSNSAAAPAPPKPTSSAAAAALSGNAMADALPLFEALAHGKAASLSLSAGSACALALSLTPG